MKSKNQLKLNSDMLLDYMAKSCSYAQEHVSDTYAWGDDTYEREKYFTCASYQIACFLAQNTINGKEGVDSDVVLEHLTELNPAVKDTEKWKNIIKSIVDELGGWSDTPGIF